MKAFLLHAQFIVYNVHLYVNIFIFLKVLTKHFKQILDKF